jgi:hypothetical protein
MGELHEPSWGFGRWCELVTKRLQSAAAAAADKAAANKGLILGDGGLRPVQPYG